MSGRIAGALSDRSLRMTCPRTRSVPTPPQDSLSGRASPLRPRPRSWMTPRRVLDTLTAPAEVRSPAWTAEPAVTPTATMPAALAAIISQRESPTYQHRFGSTPRTRQAFRSRSGAGFACATSCPSMIVGGRGSRNAWTDAPTCSCRLEVAIAQGMVRASSLINSSREAGKGFGSTFRASKTSPCRRSMRSARCSSRSCPSARADSRATCLPSLPMSMATSRWPTGMPASWRAWSHALILAGTVSTRLPSRSNAIAAGVRKGHARGRAILAPPQVCEHRLRVSVRWEHGIEHFLDTTVLGDDRDSLDVPPALELEGGQAQGLGQLEIGVAQELVRNTHADRELLLVLRTLGADSKEVEPQVTELPIMVPIGTILARASTGAWDQVPLLRHIRLPGGRGIEEQHRTPGRDFGNVHVAAGRGTEANRGHRRAREVIARPVVHRYGKPRRQPVRISRSYSSQPSNEARESPRSSSHPQGQRGLSFFGRPRPARSCSRSTFSRMRGSRGKPVSVRKAEGSCLFLQQLLRSKSNDSLHQVVGHWLIHRKLDRTLSLLVRRQFFLEGLHA